MSLRPGKAEPDRHRAALRHDAPPARIIGMIGVSPSANEATQGVDLDPGGVYSFATLPIAAL